MNKSESQTFAGAAQRRSCTALLLAAASVLGAMACSSTQPTEIVAGVSTQIRVPDELRAVGMVVQVGGQVVFCDHYPVVDGAATLPATLGVLGESGLAARGTVTVQVLGLRTEASEFAGDCVFTSAEETGLDTMVIRRRRLTFVDDQIKFLPLALKESCADTLCADDQTCVGGKCVSADIDAKTLPRYDDSLIFGNTNTCFDAKRCMAEGSTVPVQLEDRKSCTFSAVWPEDEAQPSAGNLNVRLFYQTFGTEILDLDIVGTKVDQREGFSFTDEQAPLSFRLAPNLCESNYNLDKVLAIDASVLCAAKRGLQPICDDYEPPDLHALPAGGGGGGTQAERMCTLGGLEPVESVVYVLMDHSLSMSKFFGEGGLNFAVKLPLSSPVARRTKVGFEFLPPAAEQCGTAAYASPTIPFGGVEQVREPIGAILSVADSILSDDPPQFFLQAALQGAYQGVLAVKADDESQGFNRRAVVVLSNRDLFAGACPGPSAVELASQAQEERVFTYAVALDSGEPGALASARALANAGGTTVFNGVSDEAEGARAVNDILTELGTCLYEVHRSDATPDAPLPTNASISYIGPASPSESGVHIPHDPRCREDAAATVSGWNQEEGGLVRLCGKACDDLRQVIGDVSVFHAVQGHVPPAVPLVATAPCGEFKRHAP
jgi:hypothetical protein